MNIEVQEGENDKLFNDVCGEVEPKCAKAHYFYGKAHSESLIIINKRKF